MLVRAIASLKSNGRTVDSFQIALFKGPRYWTETAISDLTTPNYETKLFDDSPERCNDHDYPGTELQYDGEIQQTTH